MRAGWLEPTFSPIWGMDGSEAAVSFDSLSGPGVARDTGAGTGVPTPLSTATQAGRVWLTGVPTPRAIGSPGYS